MSDALQRDTTPSPPQGFEGSEPDEEVIDDGEEVLEDLGQRWTTLGELGNTLPLAVGPDRSFSFKTMNLDLRAKVSEVLDKHRQRETATGLATFAIAASLESMQGQDVAGAKLEEIVALLRQLPWTSVTFVTYQLQLAKMAGEDTMQLGQRKCTLCGRPHRNAVASLRSMRVRAYGQLEQLPEETLELYDGLRFGGKVASQVTIRPARWDFMARLADGNLEKAPVVLRSALRSAICRLDSHEGIVTPDEAALGGLSERDIDLLDREHTLLSGGPLSVVEAQCQGHTWPVLYPWQSAAFFGGSRDRRSRRMSGRGKTSSPR